MKSKSKFYIRVGLLVLILAVSIHFRVRQNKIEDILSEPRDYERMKVLPKPLIISKQTSDNGYFYNLGYANFYSPSKIDLQSAGNGVWILGSNDNFRLAFCQPSVKKFDPYAHDTLFNQLLKEEQTELLPIYKFVTMGESEFKLYLKKVQDKVWQIGDAGIYTFSTTNIQSLIKVDNEYNGCIKSLVYLESISGNLGVHIHAYSSPSNSIECIKPILSSFRFSIDSYDSLASISNLIFEANILPEKRK